MAASYSSLIGLAHETPAVRRTVALKLLERVAEHWNLRKHHLPALLNRPPRTVRDWAENDRAPLEPDALERISHLLGIYDGLHRLYGDERFADQWVHRPNPAFGGHAPTELLLSGRFTALVEVRRYIEQALNS